MQKFLKKLSFIICLSIIAIFLTGVTIHIVNPTYYTQVSTFKDPKTGFTYFYIEYEFGPFEKTILLEKISPYTDVSLDNYYYSPNRKKVAFEAITLDSKRSYVGVQEIKVLDLLTLKRKTIISSVRWSNFYWKDDKTISFFVPDGNYVGYYKDVNIGLPGLLVFNDKIWNGEDVGGWTKVSPAEMETIQNRLAKINKDY